MALGLEEAAINVKLQELEVLIDAWLDGLSPGDTIYICPADVWKGTTASTNLNAKFSAGRLTSNVIKYRITDTAGNGNIVWALGVPMNRFSLTYRITNAAGDTT